MILPLEPVKSILVRKITQTSKAPSRLLEEIRLQIIAARYRREALVDRAFDSSRPITVSVYRRVNDIHVTNGKRVIRSPEGSLRETSVLQRYRGWFNARIDAEREFGFSRNRRGDYDEAGDKRKWKIVALPRIDTRR